MKEPEEYLRDAWKEIGFSDEYIEWHFNYFSKIYGHTSQGVLNAIDKSRVDIIQKISTDLTSGSYCRYVEHSQDMCACQDLKDYFADLTGSIDSPNQPTAPEDKR